MVKELLTYISHHLDEEITLEKLSKLTGYSPFHLHRKIKETLGEPIGDFIRRQRIDTSAQLLALTDIPVADIKYLVGYTNNSGFSKAFRQVTGTSPKLFRAGNILQEKAAALQPGYLSLSCEVLNLSKQEAIIFPGIGDYFSKSVYGIWKEVQTFILHEKLNENDFDYYGILHNCQNVTPRPGRYDAAIVPKNKGTVKASKFYKSHIPGGKFARYRFCCPVNQYRSNTLLINKHLSEETTLKHGTGISYFRFQSLPDYQAPDNLLIEWYIPVK